MPRVISFPDPSSTTRIGASFQVSRTAPGAAGVALVYNAANGDDPFETTASSLTPASRAALGVIHDELIALMRAARSYT